MSGTKVKKRTRERDIGCQLEPSPCSTDPVDYLPNEILWEIIGFLSVEDLCNLAVCSKAWRNVTNSNRLWLHFCKLRDWERYGKEGNLCKGQQASTSDVSPTLQADAVISGDCNLKDLAPTCDWKEVYMRAWHLDRNWSEGRYHEHVYVLSELYPERAKIFCTACDGRTFATGDYFGFVQFWDLYDGCFLRQIQLSTIIGAPDAKPRICKLVLKNNIGLAAFKGGILVFKVSTGEVLKLIRGTATDFEKYCPTCLYLEEDKVIVSYIGATSFFSIPVHVWDISGLVGGGDNAECMETKLCSLPARQFTSCLACHRHWLVTSYTVTAFALWDIRTSRDVRTYMGHEDRVECCHLDEDTIVTGDNMGNIHVWTTKSRVCVRKLYLSRGESILDVLFTDKVIVARTYSQVIFWSRDGKLMRAHSLPAVGKSKNGEPLSGREKRKYIRLSARDIKFLGNRLVTLSYSEDVLCYQYPDVISVFELSTAEVLYHAKCDSYSSLYMYDTKIVNLSGHSGCVQIMHYW